MSQLFATEDPPPPYDGRLTPDHFAAARELVNGIDALEFAAEHSATVREMKAWSRVALGTDQKTKGKS